MGRATRLRQFIGILIGMASVHRKAGALLGTALVLGTGAFFSPEASADATYSALAEATGTRLIFTNESIPLNVAPQIQGPTASAKQNSLQQSDAYAAFPYPGEEVAGVPGVVGGVAGVPLPAYPFVISTSFGDGARQLSYPGIELRSESAESLTQATATGGSTGAGATSSVRIARDGDAIVAKATTDADALRIGDTVVIRGLHATASAARDSAGKLTRTSTLAFSSLTVPGLVVSAQDAKFTVTSGTGAPSATDVPVSDVVKALTQAGYPTTYQAAKDTPDGIVGASLQITATLPAPPPGLSGGFSGETPVTYSLGLVKAEVAYTALPADAVPATGTGVDAATAGLPGTGPADELSGVDAATGLAGTVPAVGAPLGTVPTIDLAALQASRAAVGSDVGWIYLMVVAVGAAAFAGCVVLRYRGVR